MDPETIAAIVSAAQQYFSSQNEQIWKSGVSAKLDEISQKLDIVIRDLQTLKVWVADIAFDVKDTPAKIFESYIEGSKKGIEAVITARPDKKFSSDERQLILNFLSQITIGLNALCNREKYGYGHYYGVISGGIVQIFAAKALNLDEKVIANFNQNIMDYLSSALSSEDPKSIKHAQDLQSNEGNLVGGQLSPLLSQPTEDKWWTVRAQPLSDQFGSPAHPKEKLHTAWEAARAVGVPGSQLQIEIIDGDTGTEKYPWFPGIPHFDGGDGTKGADYFRSNIGNLNAHFQTCRQAVEDLGAHIALISTAIAFFSGV